MSQIGLIRFAIFVLVFAGFALLERRYPARRWRTAMPSRWLSHATLGGLSLIIPTIILRLVPILAAAGQVVQAYPEQFQYAFVAADCDRLVAGDEAAAGKFQPGAAEASSP